MDTSIVFNPRIHPPICLSRMSDVTVPPWISAFGSSLTLGPSVAPQLDHHSHGIQNNMSQQRTCHVHDHMSLSRPHVIFTTTCHFHKRQHVSPSNNMALHDITLHYVASLGVDTQHYTSPRHTTRHYVTLRCITWRRHTNIASSMLVFDCKASPMNDRKPLAGRPLVHPARGKGNSCFVPQTHRPAGSHFFNRCPVVDHCCLTQYFLHPKTTHQLVAILSTGGLLSITVARPAQRQFFLRFPDTDQLAVVFSQVSCC